MAHGIQFHRPDEPVRRWRAWCPYGWVGRWAKSQREAREDYVDHRRQVAA